MKHVASYWEVSDLIAVRVSSLILGLAEKGEKRCPHLPPIVEEFRMIDFRDQILVCLSKSQVFNQFIPITGHSERYRRSCYRRSVVRYMSLFWITASHSSGRGELVILSLGRL